MIPNNIFIEPTSFCNLNCKFCISNIRKNKGTMSNIFFEDLCSQAVELGIHTIDISPFTGEIFMDPNILNKMEILERSLIKEWCFFTNLTLMNKEIFSHISKFKKLKSISVSINGEDFESFKLLTNGNINHYNNILDNINYLFEFKNYEIHLYLKLLNLDFRSKWYKKKLTAQIFRKIHQIEYITQQFKLDDWDNSILKRNLGETLKICNDEDINLNLKCHVLDRKHSIHWNGDFHVCGCRDNRRKTFVGNLKNMSLFDVYNSEEINRIKKDWKRICRECYHHR